MKRPSCFHVAKAQVKTGALYGLLVTREMDGSRDPGQVDLLRAKYILTHGAGRVKQFARRGFPCFQ